MKKKCTDKHFIVKSGIYPFDTMVYIGEDNDNLIKVLEKYLSKEDIDYVRESNFARGKSMMFSEGQTLLWMRYRPKGIEDLGVLVHEAFHCTTFILEKSGITYSKDSDEAYAYFLQFLVEEIMTELGLTFKIKR